MNGTTLSLASPPAEPDSLHRHLLRTALIVGVLGVLPFVLDASATWQVLGTLVSLAMVTRSVQLVWRTAFSTDPRHLGRS
ncbi:hypothetical protein [Blastococcus jejuensis]|uniref:hypothetical protein n=1 Tax=Blastococcus jejuensis TaxID=351224 RepID=UPI0031DE8C1C